MSEPIQEKHDKDFTITRLEMGRFTFYAFVFFIIAFLQLRITTRFISNSNIKDHFFLNSTNIFKQDYIGRLESLRWVDKQLYRAYNLNSQTLGETFHEIVPITKLRIISTMVKRDQNTGLWDKNMKPVKEDIGSRLQYTSNPAKNGYEIFFLPFSVLQRNIKEKGSDKTYHSYGYDDLNLVGNKFLNSETQDIKIDASFYNGNINFVIEINFSSQGKVTATIVVNSFIANAYMTQNDHLRMILEIIFLALYCYYCIQEIFKVKAQIKKAFDDDAKIELIALRKKEKAEEKNESKNKRVRIGIEQISKQAKEKKKSVFVTNEHLEELQLKMQEKMNKIKKKFKLISTGLQSHISDIWSALDVANLIVIAIAIFDWILNNVTASLFQYYDNITAQSDDYYSFFLVSDIEQANDLCINQSIHSKRYRILVAVTGLIMTTKLIKYFIFVFAKLSPYQLIITNVFKYMPSFMIIILTMILSITQFLYFFYGSNIQLFSDFYDNLNYVFGMILGVNDNLNSVYDYDRTLTLFVQVLFYLLITCIMMNMFYVFVICEFAEYEQRVEEKLLKDSLNQVQQLFQKQVEHLHPLWYFYIAAEYLFLQFWFSLICKRSQFTVYMLKKEQIERIFEREFIVNVQIIDFDTNFQRIASVNPNDKQDKKDSTTKPNERFLLEGERKKILKNQRIELVQLIWRTLILVLLLILNFVLVQQFYSPQEEYLQNISIKNKIIQSGYNKDLNAVRFDQIKTLPQIKKWIQYRFPQIFDEILIGKRELQNLYQTPQPFTKNNTLNDSQQINAYMQDEFQFDSTQIGNSLNFFNIIANNLVRINIRKSNLMNNPDNRFRKIYPQVKTFFPLDPTDQLYSTDEEVKNFINNNTHLEIEYQPDQGWANSGGYNVICDVQQAGNIVKNLEDLGFFDFTTATISMEMLSVNPVNQGCLAYIVIFFAINQAGIVENYGVEVNAIKQNSLRSTQEISIISLTFLLFAYLCYHTFKTMNTLRKKNLAYKQWYDTYIRLILSKAQLHFRQRQTPEFIRKWTFLLDVPQLLSFIYLILMAFQISLIILSFYNVNRLLKACKLFGQPLEIIFHLNLFNFGVSNDYLDTAYFTTVISQVISITASLAILVLCVEILYLFSNNREFQILTKSILYSLHHLPYVMVILFFLIISFTLMGYLMMGAKMQEFSTFFSSAKMITSYIFNLESMNIFRTPNNATEFFLLALPFIVTARFIIVNMFFAILYRAYHITKSAANRYNLNDLETLHRDNGLTINEFFSLSLQIFHHKLRLPRPQSDLYMVQIMNHFNFKRIYSQIKENIRIQIDMNNIKIWGQKCGTDIKDESEVRQPVDNASDEILQAYIDLNNQGDFQILEKLNQEKNHQVIEFGLQMTYFDYYRQATQQFQKFISFFNYRIGHIQKNLYNHLQNINQYKDDVGEDQYQFELISKNEKIYEENLRSLNFIKQEVEFLGLSQLVEKLDINSQDRSQIQFQRTIDKSDQVLDHDQSLIQSEAPSPKKKGAIKPANFNRKNIGITFSDTIKTSQKFDSREIDFD